MKATLLVLLVAVPALAADVEQVLLPISPSVVHCARDSRYETRLIAFNQDEKRRGGLCTGGACRNLEPMGSVELTGEYAGGSPMPSYVYLPKEDIDTTSMSLVVESASLVGDPAARAFTEIPVVRARDFRTGKMQFIGVRMDEGFRQTVRIYGLDGSQWAHLNMSVYDFETQELLHSCLHHVAPLDGKDAQGRDLRPSFGMECDMSEHLEANGRKIRIVLEPITEGLRYWAFVSITNNETQHFYTVMPR
ncbi:MAG TPA: hypothetical protein VEK57_26730 [Thermoanaerobaculia bacterium]|nr:hypothetical protein [Thermoanaerobaculia bacterium]